MIDRLIPAALLAAISVLAADSPPAHRLFTEDNVHDVWIEFKQPDWWERLTTNYEADNSEPEYLEGSFRWNDVVFDRIGVRFKGNSSYNIQGKKKPFRLKLNEYVKGQKIDGQSSLGLSNLWNDPSMVREKVYYELAAKAGMPAPRANFAALHINGQYWGLYSLVEIVNDDFLKTRFPDDDKGSLYKGDPSGTLEDKGDDEASYTSLYEKKSNEDENWSDLMGLVQALNRTSSEQLPDAIERVLDVDSVFTALALDNITVNLDNYIGMGHNYYLYFRPSDGKAQFLVWDPSLAFGGLSQGLTVDQMKELSLEWTRTQTGPGEGPLQPPEGTPPAPPATPPGGAPGIPRGGIGAVGGGGRPLATKLWEIPTLLARYRAIARRLNEEVVHPDEIMARMTGLRAMIAPWVATDPNKLATQEQFDKALSDDQTMTSIGGGFPSGGAPPQGPGGDVPNVPQNPRGGGGMGVVPGIDALVHAREQAIRSQTATP
jgi:hypothetical protein